MNYYIYVIELDKEVGKIKSLGLKILNTYMEICFYVGQTARAPLLRFKQHKEGHGLIVL